MAAESEVIQKLLQSSGGLSEKINPNLQQCVRLCSPDANCTTINAYSVTIHWAHGIMGFLELLSSFFKRSSMESDVSSYKVSLNLGHLFWYTNKRRLYLITHVESPMTAKRLDQNKQIFSVQQTAGKKKAHGMTVSLFRDPQDQVFSLPRCLASSQFPTMTKPIA